MKVIVGLGNPGKKYEVTRHNIGFELIDYIAEKKDVTFRKKHQALVGEYREGSEKILLVKPLTYMNLSGESVREIWDYYDFEKEDLLVAYDDIDLETGVLRIRKKGSGGTHNGMASIIQQLTFQDFPRLRIGIGSPGRIPLVSYVLGRFTDEEIEIMQKAVIKAADAVDAFVTEGIDLAMQNYNG